MRTWIDVSATCNLACELCYTIELQGARKMSVPTFVAVIDRLLSDEIELAGVHLNWRGEPTSNRSLAEMVAHLAAVGLTTALSGTPMAR
jgi:organic radical activating enzyme